MGADQNDPNITVFGLVPGGAKEVELQLAGIAPLTITRVFERPQVDRAAFIGTIQESDLLRTVPGPVEIAVTGEDGSVTRLPAVEFQGAATSDGYTGPITSELFRVVPPLVVDTVTVDTVSEAIACQAPAGVVTPPNQGGPVTDTGVFASAAEALEAFLAGGLGDPPIAESGYTEMVRPDGSIVYGIDYGDGFVTLISVVQVGDGWTVESWEASGC